MRFIYLIVFILCLICTHVQAQSYTFTWEGGIDGIKAIWNPNDIQNTYKIDTLDMNVHVSIIDSLNLNTTTNNPSEYGDWTKTNTFYGRGNFAFQIKSNTSAQVVCLKFEFDKPILLHNFKVYDIDMKQNTPSMPASTYQDSVMFVGKRNGVDIPLVITPMDINQVYSIYGQAVKANYIAGANNDLDYNDLRGAINVSSSMPITEFLIHYSNGSEDDGLSNSQALKITGFNFEVVQAPLPVKISDLGIREMGVGQYSLNWTAESEINNDYYTIWVSTDGISYSKLGNKHALNLSHHRYTYDLREINLPHFYIKLEQTDFDGNTQVMGVVDHYQNQFVEIATLMSNIVNDRLEIKTKDIKWDPFKWEIYDISGQLISTGTLSSGEHYIDIYALNSGLYSLILYTSGSSDTYKFIKI